MIFQSITELVGDTPILELTEFLPDGAAKLFLKWRGSIPVGRSRIGRL